MEQMSKIRPILRYIHLFCRQLKDYVVVVYILITLCTEPAAALNILTQLKCYFNKLCWGLKALTIMN